MSLASKNATILENVSNDTKINHEINLYHRYVLKFEENQDTPSFYDLNVPNQKIANNMFNYVGKMLEALKVLHLVIFQKLD